MVSPLLKAALHANHKTVTKNNKRAFHLGQSTRFFRVTGRDNKMPGSWVSYILYIETDDQIEKPGEDVGVIIDLFRFSTCYRLIYLFKEQDWFKVTVAPASGGRAGNYYLSLVPTAGTEAKWWKSALAFARTELRRLSSVESP